MCYVTITNHVIISKNVSDLVAVLVFNHCNLSLIPFTSKNSWQNQICSHDCHFLEWMPSGKDIHSEVTLFLSVFKNKSLAVTPLQSIPSHHLAQSVGGNVRCVIDCAHFLYKEFRRARIASNQVRCTTRIVSRIFWERHTDAQRRIAISCDLHLVAV